MHELRDNIVSVVAVVAVAFCSIYCCQVQQSCHLLALFFQQTARRQKGWSSQAMDRQTQHRHTHKANWLAQTARHQGSPYGYDSGWVCVSGNQWSKMKAQTVTAKQPSSWQRKQHLLPGKSCHLARFRFSFEHLLFLTASCQKFGERIADWRTHAWLEATTKSHPFAIQPFKMIQCVCQHLALCPYHSNAMVQSLMSACLPLTVELSCFLLVVGFNLNSFVSVQREHEIDFLCLAYTISWYWSLKHS